MVAKTRDSVGPHLERRRAVYFEKYLHGFPLRFIFFIEYFEKIKTANALQTTCDKNKFSSFNSWINGC